MNANLAWNDGNLLPSDVTLYSRRNESCDFRQCYFLYDVHVMQVQVHSYLSWNIIYYSFTFINQLMHLIITVMDIKILLYTHKSLKDTL